MTFRHFHNLKTFTVFTLGAVGFTWCGINYGNLLHYMVAIYCAILAVDIGSKVAPWIGSMIGSAVMILFYIVSLSAVLWATLSSGISTTNVLLLIILFFLIVKR